MAKQMNQETTAKNAPPPIVTMAEVKDAARWCLRNHLSATLLISEYRAAIALAVLSLSE